MLGIDLIKRASYEDITKEIILDRYLSYDKKLNFFLFLMDRKFLSKEGDTVIANLLQSSSFGAVSK